MSYHPASLLAALLAVLLLLPAGAAAPPAIVPVDQPRLVSPADGYDHARPAAAPSGADGVVVVWQATTTAGYDCFARLIGPNGYPIAPAFRVNERAMGEQRRPAVATLPDGGFVVVWDTNLRAIQARRFGPDGTPRDSADLPVSDAAEGSQYDPAVAPLPDGGFVVAWQLSAATGTSIQLRRFGPDATPAGAPLTPHAPANIDLFRANPALAAGPDGAVALVWEETGLAGSGGAAVRMSAFDSAGAPLSQDAAIAQSTTDEFQDPAVAVDAAETVRVVWTRLPDGQVGSGQIELAWLDLRATALGPATTVSSLTPGRRSTPTVAVGPWGMLVAWAEISRSPADDLVGLVARVVDAGGAPISGLLVPRRPLVSPDLVSAVVAAPTTDGAWLVWGQDSITEGSELGSVYSRRIGPPRYSVALPFLSRP